jgi:hypothetical protein
VATLVRVFYDTEFLEVGPSGPVDLISIGMVREDGAELYLVNRDAPWDRIAQHSWLAREVLPQLPGGWVSNTWRPNYFDSAVQPRSVIATEVSMFCIADLEPGEKAELWAYYADYDHVVLSQLFGRMVDLPSHMPMATMDLHQLCRWNGISRGRLPRQQASTHHALADARWVRDAFRAAQDELLGRIADQR